MSNLSVFKFEESKDVRTLTDERDGSAWFVLKDVLQAMDRKGTRSNEAKASIDDGLGDGYVKTVPLQTAGGKQNTIIINEPAVTFLVSRSNTEAGKKLNRWIHAEVIPSIRKTGSYSVPVKPTQYGLEDKLKAAHIIADMLNLTGSARSGALRRTIAKIDPELLPMIPDYSIDAPVIAGQAGVTSAEPCFSITELLKRHNAPISAVTANKRLIDLGLLEEKERPSANGKSKKFKCVTKSGLKYGKNVVSDQNPRETQPQWFESTFADLFGLIA